MVRFCEPCSPLDNTIVLCLADMWIAGSVGYLYLFAFMHIGGGRIWFNAVHREEEGSTIILRGKD